MNITQSALNYVLRGMGGSSGSNGAGSAESSSSSSSSVASTSDTNVSVEPAVGPKKAPAVAPKKKSSVKISSTKSVQSFSTDEPVDKLMDGPSIQHLVSETVHGSMEWHPLDINAIFKAVMDRDDNAPIEEWQNFLTLPISGRQIRNLQNHFFNDQSPTNLVFCMDPQNQEDFKYVVASTPEHDAFILGCIETFLKRKKGAPSILLKAAKKLTVAHFRVTWTSFYARNKEEIDTLTLSGKDKDGTDALVTLPQSTLDGLNHGHELNALTAERLVATNNVQAKMFTDTLKELNAQNIDARKESEERMFVNFGALLETSIAGVHQAYASAGSSSNNNNNHRKPPATARKARRADVRHVVTPSAPATAKKATRPKAFAPVRRLKPGAELPTNLKGNECGNCARCWKKYNFCTAHGHLLDVLTEAIDV